MKKEEMVNQVRQAKEIVEEVFGVDGEPMVKAVVYTSLIKNLDITDVHTEDEVEAMKTRPGPRLSMIKPAPPGCPLITDLTCFEKGNVVEWGGTCTHLGTDCRNIDKALSFNDFTTCHTYMAKKILEARADAKSHDRD